MECGFYGKDSLVSQCRSTNPYQFERLTKLEPFLRQFPLENERLQKLVQGWKRAQAIAFAFAPIAA